MANKSYWENLNPAPAINKTVWAARKCLPLLDCSLDYSRLLSGRRTATTVLSYKDLTTKRAAMKVIGKHVACIKRMSKLIVSFMQPEWFHPQTSGVEITGIMVKPFIETVSNAIEPVDEQFIETCTDLDAHYTSHLASNQKDDDKEEEEEVVVVEEEEEEEGGRGWRFDSGHN
ncbi:hypothetical protein THAOC_21428 [Thalassiosira oceanica]|uniref:Uncharacterized protein n=1 Tax=Thalassiosira oceanica TaxID=159749 RepID=K0RZF5_THAOC|nr:hypothetical protein THAOC_21428 [Thalassiosira oceanica]|eukprot:EJK58450.1 hypothetical protein THAOC_21428 [Thalassiosira oceanica]